MDFQHSKSIECFSDFCYILLEISDGFSALKIHCKNLPFGFSTFKINDSSYILLYYLTFFDGRRRGGGRRPDHWTGSLCQNLTWLPDVLSSNSSESSYSNSELSESRAALLARRRTCGVPLGHIPGPQDSRFKSPACLCAGCSDRDC